MKINIFILYFLLFNLLIINEITAQTPIRFRAENGNIRLYDEVNNKILTKENYSRISEFSEGIACASLFDGEQEKPVVYLNEKGEKINAEIYQMSYSTCQNGLISVKIADNKYEYINKAGKKAFEGTFYYATDFSEGYAMVAKSATDVAFIDVNGKLCFEKQLKKIKEKLGETQPHNSSNFQGGTAIIKGNDKKKQFILNKKGDVFDMSPTIEKIENNTLFPNKIEKPMFTYDEGGSHFVYGMTNAGTFTVKSYIGVFMFDDKNKFVGNFLRVEYVGQKRFLVTTEKNESYFTDIKGKKISENILTDGVKGYNDDYIILKKTADGQGDNFTYTYRVFDKNLKEIKVTKKQTFDDQVENGILYLENNKQIILMNSLPVPFLVPNTLVENVLEEEVLDGIMSINETDFPIIIQNKGKFGAISQQGKLIIPCEYEEIRPFEGKYFTIAKKNGKFGKITRSNKIIESFENEAFKTVSGYEYQKRNGKWGRAGHLPFEFDEPPMWLGSSVTVNGGDMADITTYISKKNGKVGIIEVNEKAQMKEVLSHEYDVIRTESDLLIIQKDKKVGALWNGDETILVNVLKGKKMCFPVEYDRISAKNGRATITKNGKDDVIDLKTFKSIYPIGYDKCEDMWFDGVRDTHLLVTKNKKEGIFRITDNKLIIPCIYDDLEIHYYKSNFIHATKNKKIGLLDLTGKVLIPLEYDYAKTVYSDKGTLFILNKNNKQTILSKENKVIIPLTYDEIGRFYTDNTPIGVQKNGKWGFLDKDMKLFIPIEYDLPKDFNGDTGFQTSDLFPKNYSVAVLGKKGKFGIIDNENKIILPFVYDEIKSVYDRNEPKHLLNAKRGTTEIPLYWNGKTITEAK